MNKKVLIVDDDQDFVDAVETLLTANNYDTISAANGEEGFQMALAEQPDLITMDVMMADDSEGLSTAKRLTETPETKNIPVILMTGVRKAHNLTEDYTTGEKTIKVKATLEKPIKPAELLKVIERYI